MQYTISKDTNVVTVIVSDVVTLQDCIRSVDRLLTEEALQPRMQVLVDATSVNPELSFADLRELVRQLKKLVQCENRGIALTAASDFVYGLALVFSAFADIDGLKIAVFRTQKKARKWLESCSAVRYSSIQKAVTVRGVMR